MRIFNAVLYHGDVYNGGHAQFIFNKSKEARDVCAEALACLRSAGAVQHVEILEAVIAWIKANPKKLSRRVTYDKLLSPELYAFDDRFNAAENADPAMDRMAAWIKEWPNLRVLPDEQYAEALQAVIKRDGGV